MSAPPTVHDSDRKAATEIRHRLRFMIPPIEDADWLSEIIARHHAEERAAVEKVLSIAARFCSELPFKHVKELDAALTALRNASARTASQPAIASEK